MAEVVGWVVEEGFGPLPEISGKCFKPHPDMSIFRRKL